AEAPHRDQVPPSPVPRPPHTRGFQSPPSNAPQRLSSLRAAYGRHGDRPDRFPHHGIGGGRNTGRAVATRATKELATNPRGYGDRTANLRGAQRHSRELHRA